MILNAARFPPLGGSNDYRGISLSLYPGAIFTCIEHNSGAAECSWHGRVVLYSHGKQNQQGENLSFWGHFPPLWFMIDALHQRLKLAPVMWCAADVCVL